METFTYFGSNVNPSRIDYSSFFVYSTKDLSEYGEVYDSFNIYYGGIMWINEYYGSLK